MKYSPLGNGENNGLCTHIRGDRYRNNTYGTVEIPVVILLHHMAEVRPYFTWYLLCASSDHVTALVYIK